MKHELCTNETIYLFHKFIRQTVENSTIREKLPIKIPEVTYGTYIVYGV